jgi:phosphoglycerate dehydrogenase-like enzyme
LRHGPVGRRDHRVRPGCWRRGTVVDPAWTLPGVIIGPHCAGDRIGAERAAWRLASEQLRRYAAGEPLLNVVTNGY